MLHDDSETLGSYMRASGTLDHSSERQNARNREKEEEERRAEIEFLKQVLESTERDRGAEIASLKQQIEKTERQGRIQINKLQQRMASEEGLARITTMALQGQLTVMEKERGAEIASLKEQMGLMEERARCKIVNFKRQLASTQGALASAQKALASTQEALASTEDALVAKDLKVNIGVANMDIMKAKAVVSKRQLSAQVAKYAELEATYDGYRLKYREAEKWERRRAWHDRELQRIRDKARNHHVEAEHRMRRLEERQETTVKDLERNLEACEERG